jgi:thiol:disulfide interchange protein DsbC
MSIRLLFLAAAVGLLANSIASADEASVRKAFSQKFPKATVQSVTKLPYLGLYEIVVEGEVLYADDKFEYLLDGSIISTKTMTNLTDQRKQRLSAIPFNELPLELAFKKVKGNGERKLAVFSDPDCPFCKRVENDLAKLDNVTIYMFLYPIQSLHPNASDMAKKIWCAPDKVKAWDDYMQKGTVPASDASCQNPVDKIVEYGRKKGINATPTMVFPNGDRVPGAVSAAQIEALLSGKENKEN